VLVLTNGVILLRARYIYNHSCCKLGFLCLYMRMVVNHVCVARRLLDGIVWRVNNVWSYASSYPYAFVVCTGTTLLSHISDCRNNVTVHTYMLFLWLTFTAFTGNLKCVCFLTVLDFVWHGTILPSISVTHLH